MNENICVGCPAAAALLIRRDELEAFDDPDGNSHRLTMQRNEMITAENALGEAAGEIACSSLRKNLPIIPSEIPETGSRELISLVAKCPSFDRYMEKRGMSRISRLATRVLAKLTH